MTNLFDLKGKLAVVTGGRNGNLGPIWVDTLMEAGATVYTLDLPDYDVTNVEQVQEFAELVLRYAAPDIIVNNAAIDNPPTSDALFFGNFDNIMKVNIGGAINICDAFIPSMVREGGGVIVNVGSIQGNIGADWRNYEGSFEKPVGYNCSKAALIQLSRSITVQYGRYGVRSVTVAFGPYDGGKLSKTFLDKFLNNVPVGRTISEKSLKATLLFACCCPELAGQQVLVDGGYCAW